MHPLPHEYTVQASVEPDGDIVLESAGLPRLPTAAPVEFDGPGTRWSPETLLTAAVADCLALTFRGVARARRLPFVSLECRVVGTLDRVEGRTVFTAFDIHAQLLVPDGVADEEAERALRRAKDTCLITNSLTASTALSFEIVTAPLAAASR